MFCVFLRMQSVFLKGLSDNKISLYPCRKAQNLKGENVMFEVTNITSVENYQAAKDNFRVENVPNTAAGFDCCRKYIVDKHYGHKYFLSAITEKDFFLQNEKDGFSVWFSCDGNKIRIDRAWNYNTQREERAARYLKKYAQLMCLVHSFIKYDSIVEYTRYPKYAAI